jgi:VanZ family protein
VSKTARLILCLILIVLNLTVIWGNSLTDGTKSAQISESVSKPLQQAFPKGEFTGEGLGHTLVRKAGHIGEFFCLGCLLSWFFAMLCQKNWQHLLWPFVCGLAVAATDEAIQLLVPDRAGRITDVGIDAIGLCLGIVLIFLARKKIAKFGGIKQ